VTFDSPRARRGFRARYGWKRETRCPHLIRRAFSKHGNEKEKAAMKVFCSFATLVRLACWVAALCLITGLMLGHGGQTPASGAPAAGVVLNQR
jgi:hypothetical protein